MAGYTINNSGNSINLATTFTAATLLLSAQATTATLTSGHINELAFGPSGPPNATDCSILWQLATLTTAMATGGGAPTAIADDPTNRASGMTTRAGGTGGATFGVVVYAVGLNQRASYRWTAIPGQEIVIPGTNFLGHSLGGVSATYASTAGCSMHWFE